MIQFCARATRALSFFFVSRAHCVLFRTQLIGFILTFISYPLQTHASPTLKVLTTTSIIADTTREIAGDLLLVDSLMGPGVDPHLYKPSPGDIRKLSDASLILHTGLHLEGKMGDILTKLSRRTRVRAVTDAISTERLRKVSVAGDAYDPHVWFDVSLWIEVASAIREELCQLDPAHAATYSARSQLLEKKLRSLHSWCTTQIASIPAAKRVLITAHDAFGYFGRTYDIEVMAIQGISTDSEASLREINNLVHTIVTREIPAVFVESTLPTKAIEALVEGAQSRGHRVKIGGQLLSDALAEAGSDGDTYEGMVRHNVSTIVAGLSQSVVAANEVQ